MLLQLDFQSEIPIYLQLKSQIIEGIATGRLKPGAALPSVRQLASDLGINLHTVNKAYNYLKHDGFITVHRQKGVLVNSDTGPRVTEDYLSHLGSDLRPVIAEAICRGIGSDDFAKICAGIYDDILNKGGGSL